MTFAEAAAIGSTAVALLAVWLAHRKNRFEAQRAFVEFGLRQRSAAATDLVAAFTLRLQFVDELLYWDAERTYSGKSDLYRAEAEGHFKRVREEIPASTERINRAVAASQLVFPPLVLRAAHRIAEQCDVVMLGRGKSSFDPEKAKVALNGLVVALRNELQIDQIARYQANLFRQPVRDLLGSLWNRGTARITKSRSRSETH